MIEAPTAPRPEHQKLIDEFSNLYYGKWAANHRTWLGHHIIKYPNDLFYYQMILYERRPDLIIESGTYKGGGTLFFASMCDLIGHGKIVSIDRRKIAGRPEHPRITYILGRSTASDTLRKLNEMASGKTCMVVLDSDHTTGHVKRELHFLGKYVTRNQYLVCEDTYLGGHPVNRFKCGPGPKPAVDWFMAKTKDFEVDHFEWRCLVSQSPGGYLLRKNGRDVNP